MDSFLALVPVLLAFGVGFLIRSAGLASQRDGDFLFKIVFYVCVPGLAFASLARVDIDRSLILFPALAATIVPVGYLLGQLVARHLGLARPRAMTFSLASGIVNSAFALSFVQALYGQEGVARIAIFDAINNVVVYGFLYALAARANPNHTGESVMVAKLLRSPPLYGVVLGLLANVTNVHVPAVVLQTASTFGAPTGFIVALGTGIVFTLTRTDFHLSARILILRAVVGLVFAVGFIVGFDLHGMDRTIVALLAFAPVGFNTVTFSSLENLDVKLAAGTLSVSLLISLVLATTIGSVIGT